MRAFDLLSKAEQEIRLAAHPRYYFEMVLLRWMHLRKLVPLAELLLGEPGAIGAKGARGAGTKGAIAPAAPGAGAPPAPTAAARLAPTVKAPVAPAAKTPTTPARGKSQAAPASRSVQESAAPAQGAVAPNVKDALLSEIKAGKPFFYNTVVAQAQKIEVASDRVTFVFSPTHRALREQFEQSRAWVETTAERIVGRRVMVESTQGDAPTGGGGQSGTAVESTVGSAARDLKADAMSSSAIQAVLDVFPAEIRDVEEIEP